MKEIGYIVSQHNINMKFDYVKVVKDISETEKDKPCLIIGLSEAKKFASDNFSILNKKLSDNVFWTYWKTEKRSDYEQDVKKFYQYALDNYINKVKYVYLNVLTINYNILKRLIRYVNNDEKKYIYMCGNMIYLQCDKQNIVGISMEMCDFCGLQRKKIISKIKANKNNLIVEDIKRLSKRMQTLLQHKQYAVPYIMALEE